MKEQIWNKMVKSRAKLSTHVVSQAKNILMKDLPKSIQVYERIQL